ncbi:hypothetical protein JTL52_18085 [Pseudomonas aeruginosa]|nr:hypothetical protein [Pseudomonas aeruginosa]
MSNINPAVIHEIAAQLFWKLADDAGFNPASKMVLSTEGEALFDQAATNRIVGRCLRAELNNEDAKLLFDRVREECCSLLMREENPQGILYHEDAQACISPEAKYINAKPLDVAPSSLQIEGAYEEMGALCIRHPLPAVVFATRPNSKPLIKVADTRRALGFSYPIFMVSPSVRDMGNGLYALTGIMRIPVVNEDIGDGWDKVILNSTRFVAGFKCYTGLGKVSVGVDWSR